MPKKLSIDDFRFQDWKSKQLSPITYQQKPDFLADS